MEVTIAAAASKITTMRPTMDRSRVLIPSLL
jgi:hypothetical protein